MLSPIYHWLGWVGRRGGSVCGPIGMAGVAVGDVFCLAGLVALEMDGLAAWPEVYQFSAALLLFLSVAASGLKLLVAITDVNK